MSNPGTDDLNDEMGMNFPVITISVSYDDINEPIHVDLGSIPPFVAVSVFQQILETMKDITVGPKITFGGNVIADPSDDFIDIDDLSDFDDLDDDDEEEDDE